MNAYNTNRSGEYRSGVVLIVVLVTVALLSLVLYSFTDRMIVEEAATRSFVRQAQSKEMVHAGVAAALVMLADPDLDIESNGGLFDNPNRFARLQINGTRAGEEETALVSLLAPNIDADGFYRGWRFGLLDESSKLNLNMLVSQVEDEETLQQSLLQLPGMTQEIIDAIRDWIDADDEPSELGAEITYYGALEEPYKPRNGPLQSVDELLLVRGISADLLYGLDQNRNGQVDEDEQSIQLGPEVENLAGEMDLGWSAYLTVYSGEQNRNSEGAPRVFLNGSDLEQLSTDLQEVLSDPDWVTFILAYRLAGKFDPPQNPDDSEDSSPLAPESINGRSVDLSGEPKAEIENVLDLIGALVRIQFDGEDEPTVIESPFQDEPATISSYLTELMDAVTVNESERLPGRININQAPLPVLLACPEMSPETASLILAQRYADPQQAPDAHRFATWLLEEEIVTLDEMRSLSPFITGAGHVYRAQVVGFLPEGMGARAEVVIDATQSVPAVLLWKDMTSLGLGFDPADLGGTSPPLQ